MPDTMEQPTQVRYPTNRFTHHDATRKLVEVWEGLLRRAMEAKDPYSKRCRQIDFFYSGDPDFMWNAPYQSAFMGGAEALTASRFKICINKAFEYVAVMKPRLFWQMATRKVKPHQFLNLDPMQLFGIQMPAEGEQLSPEQDQLARYAMEMGQQQAMENEKSVQRAEVLQHILNYFPAEQPGGLAAHINKCLDDALLYGAAFMKTEHYQFPQSNKTLVKSVRIDPKDVLVDPDSKDPLWLDAKWVAIRHLWHFADAEKYFDLPPGSLRSYTTKMSSGGAWQRGGQQATQQRDVSPNMIEWWECYSRAGCGNQLIGTREEIHPEFDEAVSGEGGNCAYLCIVKGCPYPLNLPSKILMDGIFNDEQEMGLEPPGAPWEWIAQQLQWPTEYWRDNKWPVTKLVFYPHSNSGLWPEPPLSPAIGELTAMNIFLTAQVDMTWANRQQFCSVMKGLVTNLSDIQNSTKNPLMLEIEPSQLPGVAKSVSDVISFMNRPEINGDLPKTMEYLNYLFEQRTGMTRRMYGEQGGATPRSAQESAAIEENTNLRPEYMRKCVAEWQSAVADSEVLCAYTHVRASDMARQLGPLGMAAYEMLITNADPEEILRGCDCYIEASAIARPNKERDAAFLDRMQQTAVPILSNWMAMHNDPGPLNSFWRAIGDASGIDVEQFLIPTPEPDNQAVQMQQAMQQAELQKTQAEATKLNAEAQAAGGTNEMAMQDAQLKAQQAEHAMGLKEHDAQLKAQQAEHKMAIAQATAEAKIQAQHVQTEQKAVANHENMLQKNAQAEDARMTKAQQARQQMILRQEEAKQKLFQEMMKGRQASQQSHETHQQALTQAEEKAQQDARHSNMIMMNRMMMNGLNQKNGNSA